MVTTEHASRYDRLNIAVNANIRPTVLLCIILIITSAKEGKFPPTPVFV